jgi:hypothetical protein
MPPATPRGRNPLASQQLTNRASPIPRIMPGKTASTCSAASWSAGRCPCRPASSRRSVPGWPRWCRSRAALPDWDVADRLWVMTCLLSAVSPEIVWGGEPAVRGGQPTPEACSRWTAKAMASATRVSAPMALANVSAASYRPNDSAAKPTPITGAGDGDVGHHEVAGDRLAALVGGCETVDGCQAAHEDQPCPSPATTAPARKRASECCSSARTARSSPSGSTSRPMPIATRPRSPWSSNWATLDAPNTAKTTPPATAKSPMPSSPRTNVGASEVNNPTIANPAKPVIQSSASPITTPPG